MGRPAMDDAITLGTPAYRRRYSATTSGLIISMATSLPPRTSLYGGMTPQIVRSAMDVPTPFAFRPDQPAPVIKYTAARRAKSPRRLAERRGLSVFDSTGCGHDWLSYRARRRPNSL